MSTLNVFNKTNFKNAKVVMDLMRPELNMPSLSSMPRATTMLQELECYSSRAQGILKEQKFDYKAVRTQVKLP